ncbi:MAG: carbohydrate-binding family 9-like protein [Sedimentisphaerales bacterium]|nr:carbohydrate-binding family 9-like protein [Sedimentisphaerales bacterium]
MRCIRWILFATYMIIGFILTGCIVTKMVTPLENPSSQEISGNPEKNVDSHSDEPYPFEEPYDKYEEYEDDRYPFDSHYDDEYYEPDPDDSVTPPTDPSTSRPSKNEKSENKGKSDERGHLDSSQTEMESSENDYICRYADRSIRVDGRLNEACWSKAERIEDFFLLGKEKKCAPRITQAMLLWKNSHLCFAVVCKDDDVWSYTDQHDGKLWNGDVVELFIKPFVDKPVYYELEFSPNETVFDARFMDGRTGGLNASNLAWESEAIVACNVVGTPDRHEDQDICWVLEAAIPLKAFSGDGCVPANGTQWTFAVCRYDYSRTRPNPLLMMSSPGARNGFHSHEVYKPLRFVK